MRSAASPFRRLFLGIGSCALLACGPGPGPADANTDAFVDTSHAAVLAIVRTTCVFSACHGGPRSGAGMLNLMPALGVDGGTAMSLRELLVDQPSCEYDAMPLVTAGDPARSWLIVKLESAHTGMERTITFTPDSSWDPGLVRRGDGTYPASVCPLVSRGQISFGVLMPQGSGTEAPVLSTSQLATIRGWVLAGAPGP